VTILLGGNYRGPGGPDPGRTREQREAELGRMMRTGDGQDIILALAREAWDMPRGTYLPIGTRLTQMVEAILQHEYDGT
jgi:hypothetical protein